MHNINRVMNTFFEYNSQKYGSYISEMDLTLVELFSFEKVQMVVQHEYF